VRLKSLASLLRWHVAPGSAVAVPKAKLSTHAKNNRLYLYSSVSVNAGTLRSVSLKKNVLWGDTASGDMMKKSLPAGSGAAVKCRGEERAGGTG